MYVMRRLFSVQCMINASCRVHIDKRSFAKAHFRQPQKQLQQLVMVDTHYMQRQKSGILELFPNVRGTVKNMFYNLKENYNSSLSYQNSTTAIGRINNQLVYQCIFTANWPKPITFHGYGFKKKDAEVSAMIKALEMLYNGNFVTAEGHPITVSKEEKQKLIEQWTRSPNITVPETLLAQGWNLLDEFKREVQPWLDKKHEMSSLMISNNQENSEDDEIPGKMYCDKETDDFSDWDGEYNQTDTRVLNLLTGREYTVDVERNHRRSREMQENLSETLSYSEDPYLTSKSLPISKYKNELEEALEKHQIVIVAGDTGCGKSTQVPQMILNKWIMEGKGADCNILISQPRRISAISLAKYVAKERREKLGETVGYHVRLSYKRLENHGGVMFLTTGMLLQGLHANSSLEGVSHVIVDEVHERSVQTDMLLILLRRLIQENKNLKLILMSASLSTKQLQNYFGEEESTLIEVPGALYPLNRLYLDKVLRELELSPKRYHLGPLMETGFNPAVNTDLVVDVIKAIEFNRPPGAILCFLPGWQDISVVQARLNESPELQNRLWVLPLHSRLASSDQEQIFESAPSGLRKVVLATNIAETSLTVEDVVYVIDTGCHKEQRYDSKKDLSVLGNHWISRANSQQRAGRAGRVQPGEVFHLYSKNIHKNMSSFPVPEIMRIPLEHVVLQCKAHCGEESALTFLSEGLSVPTTKLIAAAISNLEDLGMIMTDRMELVEKLTPLGRRVLGFSTSPPLSKALVYSSIFRCVDPVLAISAALSGGRGIFHNSIELRSENREVKASIDPTSDLIALLGLISEWEKLNNYRDSINYCNENNLSHKGLMYNNGIKRVYGDHLKDGFLVDDDDLYSYNSKWNMNSHNTQLILGTLLAGVNRILLLRKGLLSKGILKKNSSVIKTMDGITISTGSDCVLHTIPEDLDESSRHLLCVHLTRDDASRRTIARDLSLLKPLTVVIFAGHSVELLPTDDGYLLAIDGMKKISFMVDKRTGSFLSELREVVDQMASMIIETRGLDDSLSETVVNISDRLVQYISELLEVEEMKALQKRSILYDKDDMW